MMKYLATIDKEKADRFMRASRLSNALKDLKCALVDIEAGNSDVSACGIEAKEIAEKIDIADDERQKALEDIRGQYGWLKEDMEKIYFTEDYKAYSLI